MELTFGWIAAILGLVGSSLSCFLAGKAASHIPEQPSTSRKTNLYPGAILLLLTTLVFWLVSTRTMPPFSRGQSLGLGFLIGGGASLVALLESRRTGFKNILGSFRSRGLAMLSMTFFSVFITALVYVLFSSYPQNAILGLAIGACMGGVISRLMTDEGDDFAGELMDAFSITTVLLAATTLLSVAHFSQDTSRIWWALPVLLGATSSAAAFVGIEIASASKFEAKPGLQVFIASVIAAVITCGLTSVYATKIAQNMELLKVACVSLVVWGMIAWQAHSTRNRSLEHSFEAAAVVYTVVLAFLVAAFKLWSGLGIAAGLLVGLPIIIPALADKDANNHKLLSGAFFSAVAAALYRLFLENYYSGDIRVHYTMIGAMAAVILMMLLAAVISRSTRASSCIPPTFSAFCMVMLTGSIGLLASTLPLIMMLIWDIKAVLGLVFGIVFAQAMLGFAAQCAGANPVTKVLKKIPLLLIGAQLMAIQFVGPILTTEATRSVRIWILAIASALFVVWMLVLDLLSNRKGVQPCSVDQS